MERKLNIKIIGIRQYLTFFLGLFINSCFNTINFDKNLEIDGIIKKNLIEYSNNVKVGEYEILILRKTIKKDTMIFKFKVATSIKAYISEGVHYKTRFQNKNLFLNFNLENNFDSIGILDGVKCFRKEEYEPFLRGEKIPPPTIIMDIGQRELIFYKGKLIKIEHIRF